MLVFFFFFFSSRRRHTRYIGDWSSDVCSSDLPRAGASLVWGYVRAGSARNVVPSLGEAGGTLRVLDVRAWEQARQVVTELVAQVVAPYGVSAELQYQQGVPPVVNTASSARLLTRAGTAVVGASGVVGTEQSLGGED